MLYIHSMETFGTQDGPGVRLVVFLQGCQFKCLYCHNPDTQAITCQAGDFLLTPQKSSSLSCQSDEKSNGFCRAGKAVEEEEIIKQLEKIRPYTEGARGGGLTVSGGEPTLQAAGVLRLFKLAHEAGFQTALDSNGGLGVKSDVIKELLAETDLLLLDVKQINEAKHLELTGASNKGVLETAAWREASGKPMWLRYVLVPGWSDDEADLRAWAKQFADYKMIERVEILPYHRLGVSKYEVLGWDYKLAGVETPSQEVKERARAIFGEFFGVEKVVLK